MEKGWNEGREQTIQSLEEAIKEEKTAQWRAEGQELLIQAKKENVLFQLEAAYRERLMNAYTEVYPLNDNHLNALVRLLTKATTIYLLYF